MEEPTARGQCEGEVGLDESAGVMVVGLARPSLLKALISLLSLSLPPDLGGPSEQ